MLFVAFMHGLGASIRPSSLPTYPSVVTFLTMSSLTLEIQLMPLKILLQGSMFKAFNVMWLLVLGVSVLLFKSLMCSLILLALLTFKMCLVALELLLKGTIHQEILVP